ncbi:MAG: alpha/beta hydrolase [Planctomycetia bacterium]|nr:alpha/beta hydrolase [Planctomycetia bacterium]
MLRRHFPIPKILPNGVISRMAFPPEGIFCVLSVGKMLESVRNKQESCGKMLESVRNERETVKNKEESCGKVQEFVGNEQESCGKRVPSYTQCLDLRKFVRMGSISCVLSLELDEKCRKTWYFARRFSVLSLFCMLIFLVGCNSSRLTRSRLPSPWKMAHFPRYSATFDFYSEPTQVLLRTLSLDKKVNKNPKRVLETLNEAFQESPRLDLLGMMAEVSFMEGKRQVKSRRFPELAQRNAAEWHLRAARYSYEYLFHAQWEGVRNPYEPLFQRVSRIYNESSEQILRLAGYEDDEISFEKNGSIIIDLPDAPRAIPLRMRSVEWCIADFTYFRFASDFEVTGLRNRYRRYGLGVPLVARCRSIHQKPTRYRYCLQELCVPMTAFLRFSEEGVPEMEIIDTMECNVAEVGNIRVPLEIDYTTPLAYSFELTLEKNALDGATLGLLSPDALLKETEDGTRQLKGIYMPQAYDAEKIPVVMIHGLWSSAMTWMEMYNTLNNLPILREKYQFWFYFYPNGQPFWVSAAQLRDDLNALRHELDPTRENAHMDQMVLVGHSMGGLVALLQTIDSQERFWNLITATPVEQLPGTPESNQEVARWFHTVPNPSVNCVITLGTPFKGSGYANKTTRGLTGIMGKKATLVETNLDKFREENQKFIQNEQLLDFYTALDSLQKDSIFWSALLESTPAPWVTYYNVVAHLKADDAGSHSDGVVSVESATLPWATQEYNVTALHREITNNAEAILSVARILAERLENNSKNEHNP